jgi:hypothetical protein
VANQTPRQELQAAWVVLRLGLREAAALQRSVAAPRIAALPAAPPDPSVVEPLARLLVDQLARESAEGEPSPTLRLVKRAFRPSQADKRRRNIEKAFNDYLKAWQAQKTG